MLKDNCLNGRYAVAIAIARDWVRLGEGSFVLVLVLNEVLNDGRRSKKMSQRGWPTGFYPLLSTYLRYVEIWLQDPCAYLCMVRT